MKAISRTVGRIIGSIITFLVAAVVVWFFGAKTTITALDENGESLTGAVVKIDGEEVGKTPYSTRLIPGNHQIVVLPPEGYTNILYGCFSFKWRGV